jgi:hypothetical protein
MIYTIIKNNYINAKLKLALALALLFPKEVPRKAPT